MVSYISWTKPPKRRPWHLVEVVTWGFPFVERSLEDGMYLLRLCRNYPASLALNCWLLLTDSQPPRKLLLLLFPETDLLLSFRFVYDMQFIYYCSDCGFFVTGYPTSLHADDFLNALYRLFRSCGEILYLEGPPGT